MKTDPRVACTNEKENWLWAAIHDGLAHPFMVITLYSALAMRFHNYTSHRAWPRPEPFKVRKVRYTPTAYGYVCISEIAPNIYEFSHPRVAHTYRFNADDMDEVMVKVLDHLLAMSAFGGKFAKMHSREWMEVKL